MASDKEFVAYAASQMAAAGTITYRSMFGEYGIYCDGKFVAQVSDNRLFIKPTAEGRAFLGDEIEEASPYPGAKPSILIGERIEDAAWLSELLQITERALPARKPKKPKKAKSAKTAKKE